MPGAPVDTLTLTPESIEVVVHCEVTPDPKAKEPLTEEFFQKRLSALNDSVQQFSDKPICLASRGRDNYDDDHWVEEMTGTGTVKIEKVRVNAVSTKFYVVSRTTAPKYGKEYISHIEASQNEARDKGEPLMTWEEFLKDQKTIYWRNAVERNACRLAQRVAEKLQLQINTQIEDGTVQTSIDQAGRITAEPTFVQFISSFGLSKGPTGEILVSQYSHCSPVNASSEKGGRHMVCVSPLIGHVMIHVPFAFKPASGVFPTTTGRKTARGALDPAAYEANVEYRSAIEKRCTWQGIEQDMARQPTPLINDRLHPDAYRDFDKHFIERNLINQKWSNGWHVDKFETVIAKVADARDRPVPNL
jgi:hypothetical protein